MMVFIHDEQRPMAYGGRLDDDGPKRLNKTAGLVLALYSRTEGRACRSGCIRSTCRPSGADVHQRRVVRRLVAPRARRATLVLSSVIICYMSVYRYIYI